MAFGYQVLGFGSAPTAAAVEFLWGGDRAVVVGGYHGAGGLTSVDEMEYFAISTTGNAVDFGDLSSIRGSGPGASSNGSRGILGGGTGATDIIEYWTFASLGDVVDFGDLSAGRTYASSTGGNGTRGIWAGGGGPGASGEVDIIEYVNIASTGNTTDFGDLVGANRKAGAGCNSDTRMLICGGDNPAMNIIEYITMATTGNSVDFGDLTTTRDQMPGAFSNTTRGVIAGDGAVSDTIDYVTIASLGNATDFGDLTVTRGYLAPASNNTRGTWSGGEAGTKYDIIEYVTIATTGNSTDFGDLTRFKYAGHATSGD